MATVALGLAIHMRDGLVDPGGIALLAIAVGASAISFVRPPRRFAADDLAGALPRLLATAIAVQFAVLLTCPVPDGWHLDAPTWPFRSFLAVAGILVTALIRFPTRCGVIFPLILLSFLAAGTWVLQSGSRPRIDVWTVQTKGVDAALHGRDPWSVSFEDVYHLPDLYAPGTVRDGMVHLGFPYPPLTLLMDMPGHLLLGDYRYSNLAAMALAAIFIACPPGPHRTSGGGVVFVYTAGFPGAAQRMDRAHGGDAVGGNHLLRLPRTKLLPWALGLLLVSKQYMLCAIAPAFLLIGRPLRWREMLASFRSSRSSSAQAVSLPLALWNFRAFLNSNFLVAGGAKFRMDALSFFAYYANIRDWTPPAWIGSVSFLAAVPITIFAMRRAARTPAGFATALGLVFIFFFSLNKFAFCNYYYFVVGTFCVSIAASAAAQVEAAIESPTEFQPVPLAA